MLQSFIRITPLTDVRVNRGHVQRNGKILLETVDLVLMAVVRRCVIILGFVAHLMLWKVAEIAVVHPALHIVRCSSLPLVHVLLLLVVAVPGHRTP